MKPQNKIIIVTDLDGSLLDHHTYSYQAAGRALDEIHSRGIPLIFNTSKTAAELITIRDELNNVHPFIVENGAGVMIPKNYFPELDEELITTNAYQLKVFGIELNKVITVLHTLRDETGVSFRGLSEMSVEEIVSLTGLTPKNARQAQLRDFSEPIIWQDSDQAWQIFSEKLFEHQIAYHRGGRFIHLSGGGDKGQAVEWLRHCFRSNWHAMPTIVALGDGENDVPMLRVADIPVIVRSPVNPIPKITDRDDIMITKECGPAGWNSAVLEILNKIIQKI